MVSTMSTLISNVATLPGANLSMLVLLAKATVINPWPWPWPRPRPIP